MNILFTSVGRRTYLIDYFKKEIGAGGKIHAANSNGLTTAFSHADYSVITPVIYSEEYIPFLLEYCKKNKIDAVISLFDVDLPVLAKNRAKFEKQGTRLVVSDEKFVGICNDKWKSYLFFKENDFLTPKTYLTYKDAVNAVAKGEICFPIIIKPRFGMGSLGIRTAHSLEDLNYLHGDCERKINDTYLKYESCSAEEYILYQEKLCGEEYGIDIINDLHANNLNAIVKKKLAMRSGETDAAETVDNERLKGEAVRLGKISGHIANLDSDWFLINGEPYILEMNARFGGGYPFSHIAGVNLPQAIIKWLQGKEAEKEILEAEIGIKAVKEIEIVQVV